MKVTNQKPVELQPTITTKINGPYDVQQIVVDSIVQQINIPLNTAASVVFSQNNNTLTTSDIADLFLNAINDNVSYGTLAKQIASQTLIHYKQNTLLFDSLFVVQSASKHNLPLPSSTIIYTPTTDVIPIAKGYLAGNNTFDEWFATLSFYAPVKALGVVMNTETDYDLFKQFVQTQLTSYTSLLSVDTIQMFNDFQNTKLNDLTEAFVLRNDITDALEEYSFARVLLFFLHQYVQQNNNTVQLMPFSLEELIVPQTLIFINTELHAKAKPNQIKQTWYEIQQSTYNKPIIYSKNKLTKLTQIFRNQHKTQSTLAHATQNTDVNTLQNTPLSKTPPTSTDTLKRILKVIKKMADVNRSQNIYRTQQKTYQKPNRRDPDDFNKMGTTYSQHYKPDLHLYIDTSGSISEPNYQQAVKLCIALARKLNVNIYFNSFSHVMSEETLLKTQNKSVAQLYKEFQRVLKVTGGTNYEQIWHYINTSPKRTKRLSLIITDFEYCAPSKYIKHPNNLYYVPCDQMNFKNICYYAGNFIKSMEHNDPNFRKKVLF